MTNKKYITPEGKTKLLQLGFLDNEKSVFKYLALGGESSSGAANEDALSFVEVSGDGYQRVPLNAEDLEVNSQSITLTGIFDDTNYSVADGGVIKEIAIVNSFQQTSEETFFVIAEVPEITKTDNISLKYSIIITIP